MSLSTEELKGVGLGLRPFLTEFLLDKPLCSWLEILVDNHLSAVQANPFLPQLRKDYLMTFHGVGLSIAGNEPLDITYIGQIKQIIEQLEPTLYTEHLAWTQGRGYHFHDLLPLPYNKASLEHVAQRIEQVQDYLQCSLVLENPTSYLTFVSNDIEETEFFLLLQKRTGCRWLLDINNIIVNAANFSFDPFEYLNRCRDLDIAQYHLAGHETVDGLCLDTHGKDIEAKVWELFERALYELGPHPACIERDSNFPTDVKPFLNQWQQAQSLWEKAYESAKCTKNTNPGNRSFGCTAH